MVELRPFVDALRGRDIKKAREWFERVGGELGPKDGFWAGYRLALQGMLSALESGSEMSVIWRLVNERCSRGEIEGLLKAARKKASRPFRPRDELGYDKAWSDFLSAWLKHQPV